MSVKDEAFRILFRTLWLNTQDTRRPEALHAGLEEAQVFAGR